MRLNSKCSSKDTAEVLKCSNSLRKLSNFCNSYTPEDIDELSTTLIVAMVDKKYPNYTKRTKVRLLDYFEAIEEVLPALFDLHDHITLLCTYEGEQPTYEQQIAYRKLFASLNSQS